eukprot:scaffold7328_cov314-Pinguiococcus_pyrenoidosus.AAC.88
MWPERRRDIVSVQSVSVHKANAAVGFGATRSSGSDPPQSWPLLCLLRKRIGAETEARSSGLPLEDPGSKWRDLSGDAI